MQKNNYIDDCAADEEYDEEEYDEDESILVAVRKLKMKSSKLSKKHLTESDGDDEKRLTENEDEDEDDKAVSVAVKKAKKETKTDASTSISCSEYNNAMTGLEDAVLFADCKNVTISNETIPMPEDYSSLINSDQMDQEYSTCIPNLAHYWVKDSITTKRPVKFQKAEGKREKEAKLVEFKDKTRLEMFSYIRKANIKNEKACIKEALQTRLMKVHFKIALYIYIGKLLNDSVKITEYFQSSKASTKFTVGVDSKGRTKQTGRKAIKDNFRKQFLKLFDTKWLDAQSIIFFETNTEEKEANLDDLQDSDEEEIERRPMKSIAKASKVNLKINQRQEDRPQFVELYLTNQNKHQLKYLNSALNDLEELQSSLESPEKKAEVQKTMIQLESLMQHTILSKVGVSTEKDSHWQTRMSTFTPIPSASKFECINIECSKRNAKVIESLGFAILQHLGLKVSNKKTKSTQGEFFKLYVLDKNGNMVCSEGDIINVLKYCSEIQQDKFDEWEFIYEEKNLGDLKSVESWTFSTDTIDKFFDVPDLKYNYERYYSRKSTDELELESYEKEYLLKNQSALSFDTVKVPVKGMAQLDAMLDSIIDIDNDIDDVIDNVLSESSERGIFTNDTSMQIVETICAKCNIGLQFSICIIGVFNVISIFRLIIELSALSNVQLQLQINLIDILQEKLDEVQQLLECVTLNDNTQVLYKCRNFLHDENSDYQKFNCVLCFINASSSKLFAVKMSLLQLYCRKQQSGLQHILVSKKIVEDVNSAFEDANFKPNAVTAKLFCAAPTFGYDKNSTEYKLRDLYSISRIREIYQVSGHKEISDEMLEIWRTLELQVKKEISQWAENSSQIQALIDKMNTAAVMKTSELAEDPTFQVGGGISKRIIVTLHLKQFLNAENHDNDIEKMIQYAVDCNDRTRKIKLASKVDLRLFRIFLNMQKVISKYFVDVALCCGYSMDCTVNERDAIERIFDVISALSKDTSYQRTVCPQNFVELHTLQYSVMYKTPIKVTILEKWTPTFINASLKSVDTADVFETHNPDVCKRRLLLLPLKPIEESFEEKLNNFNAESNKIVAKAEGFKVSEAQMSTLNGQRWVNSANISFFMRILQESINKDKVNDDKSSETCFLDFDIIDKLIANRDITRTVRNFKLHKKKRIFFLINIENAHYTLILVDRVDKVNNTVSYFDSKSKQIDTFTGNQYTTAIMKFMSDHSIWGISEQNFSIKQIPHFIQNDGFNCGILVCIMLDYLGHNEEMTCEVISASTLEKMRVKLACVIKFSTLNEITECDNPMEVESTNSDAIGIVFSDAEVTFVGDDAEEHLDQCDRDDAEENLDQCDGDDAEEQLNQCNRDDAEENLDQCDGDDAEEQLNQCDRDDAKENLDQCDGDDVEEQLDQCDGDDPEVNQDQCDRDDVEEQLDQCDGDDVEEQLDQCDGDDAKENLDQCDGDDVEEQLDQCDGDDAEGNLDQCDGDDAVGNQDQCKKKKKRKKEKKKKKKNNDAKENQDYYDGEETNVRKVKKQRCKERKSSRDSESRSE